MAQHGFRTGFARLGEHGDDLRVVGGPQHALRLLAPRLGDADLRLLDARLQAALLALQALPLRRRHRVALVQGLESGPIRGHLVQPRLQIGQLGLGPGHLMAQGRRVQPGEHVPRGDPIPDVHRPRDQPTARREGEGGPLLGPGEAVQAHGAGLGRPLHGVDPDHGGRVRGGLQGGVGRQGEQGAAADDRGSDANDERKSSPGVHGVLQRGMRT